MLYTFARAHTYTYVYEYIRVDAHMRTHIHKDVHMRVRVHACKYLHIQTHADTRAPTETHDPADSLWVPGSFGVEAAARAYLNCDGVAAATARHFASRVEAAHDTNEPTMLVAWSRGTQVAGRLWLENCYQVGLGLHIMYQNPGLYPSGPGLTLRCGLLVCSLKSRAVKLEANPSSLQAAR